MDSICGADCANCKYGKENRCLGCSKTKGCPFGKECFIAKYILTGGKENFENFKKQLIEEINNLKVEGMPKIDELYPLNGSFVNLAYPMPNGECIKLLDDKGTYLGNQVECEFNNDGLIRCFGIIANMEFILVSEYGINGDNPQLIIYIKR